MVVEPLTTDQEPAVATGPAGQATGRRRAALRSGLVIAGLGILTVLPFYLWLYSLQSADQSAAAIGMSSMHMNRMGVFWSFPLLQASGLTALIWAYLGVALGLVQSGRNLRWLPLSKGQTDRLHRQISLLVIGLILVHAVATAFDAMGDNLKTVFVPWQESWTAAVFAYNIGIFALYLALLLGPTYYLRSRLGPRAWRIAHRFVLVVYILAVWHTLIIGADVEYYSWIRPFIWMMQVPLLAVFVWRLARPARSMRQGWARALRYSLTGIGAAAAIWITIIVADGSYTSVVRSIQ